MNPGVAPAEQIKLASRSQLPLPGPLHWNRACPCNASRKLESSRMTTNAGRAETRLAGFGFITKSGEMRIVQNGMLRIAGRP